MTAWQRLTELFWDSLWAVMAALAGAIVWVVRKLLTSEKQIDLLKEELRQMNSEHSRETESRERQRIEDRLEIRERLSGIETRQETILTHLLNKN